MWEETGFDISSRITDEDYVELTKNDQRIRLYIIKGVPEDTVFETQTRKEISVSFFLPSFSRNSMFPCILPCILLCPGCLTIFLFSFWSIENRMASLSGSSGDKTQAHGSRPLFRQRKWVRQSVQCKRYQELQQILHGHTFRPVSQHANNSLFQALT